MEKGKIITVPYLSVSKLERTFDLAAKRNFTEVSAELFKGYGFGKADALLAVNALKFLGVIDHDGRPTELMLKLRLRGKAKQEALEDIVHESYKRLFDTIDAPQDLSTEELTNEFYAHYRLSERVVRGAVPVFIKLCEFAGLKAEGSIKTRGRPPKSEKVKPAKPSKKIIETPPQDFNIIPLVKGRLGIAISQELQNKILLDKELGEKFSTWAEKARDIIDEPEQVKDETADLEKNGGVSSSL